jgi:hypothetical protein
MDAHRLQKLTIGAVALHSAFVGVALLTRPIQTLHLAGWEHEGSTFFPAQAGVFHLILAAVYLTAIRHQPLAWILVGAKTTAFVFLTAEYVAGNGPSVLLLMAVSDGLMGVAVAALVAWNMRSRREPES